MSTLQNMVSGIQSNINSTLQNIMSGAQDTFNSIVGGITSTVSGLYSGDVVGINIEQIPPMQEAIRKYVEAIDEHLKEVNTNADTSNAYKGEFATAIKSYVEAVCSACGALTSNLLEFNAKLDEVRQKYQAHDEDLKSQLSSQASEMNSSFKRYTE